MRLLRAPRSAVLSLAVAALALVAVSAPAEGQGWRKKLGKAAKAAKAAGAAAGAVGVGGAAGAAAGVVGAGGAADDVRAAQRMKDAAALQREPAPFAGTYLVTVALGADTARAVVRTARRGSVPFMADSMMADLGDTPEDEARTKAGWFLQGVAALDSAALPATMKDARKADAARVGGALAFGVPVTTAAGVRQFTGVLAPTFGPGLADPAAERVFGALRASAAADDRAKSGRASAAGTAAFVPDGRGGYTLRQAVHLRDGRTADLTARQLSTVAYEH